MPEYFLHCCASIVGFVDAGAFATVLKTGVLVVVGLCHFYLFIALFGQSKGHFGKGPTYTPPAPINQGARLLTMS
jgi:hypothetical protein